MKRRVFVIRVLVFAGIGVSRTAKVAISSSVRTKSLRDFYPLIVSELESLLIFVWLELFLDRFLNFVIVIYKFFYVGESDVSNTQGRVSRSYGQCGFYWRMGGKAVTG